MAHIHEKIDFVVSVWIVYAGKVLLIFHKGAQKWLPIGGHIELDEDSDEALFREVKEECGLEIEIVGEEKRAGYPTDSTKKLLLTPAYVDIHPIKEGHRHLALEYFARAKSDKATLASEEHDEIRWFSREELKDPKYNLMPDIIFFAEEALKRVR
jgi:8-oxo-dGTP pyrophosphatase MutT (NUDIX family)